MFVFFWGMSVIYGSRLDWVGGSECVFVNVFIRVYVSCLVGQVFQVYREFGWKIQEGGFCCYVYQLVVLFVVWIYCGGYLGVYMFRIIFLNRLGVWVLSFTVY